MCGIAGMLDPDGCEPNEDLIVTMLGMIRHRGPDSFGIYRDEMVELGSSRLSIIDLAGGDQPISNEDGSIWIVYNGEIFNYPELRTHLIEKGHCFSTMVDTEVIVHLYEEYGREMFDQLNGQFAFALWDRNNKALMLGRDRMGVRPLFYSYHQNRIVFASEIKAIFADKRIHRQIDYGTLSDILTCWSPLGGKTVFKNVFQVEPGQYLMLSRNNLFKRRYWQLSFTGRDNGDSEHRSVQDYADQLESLICDAIRIRLRADVPVGAYLSGGLDSTFITSVIKKKFNNRLCTFSVGFVDERFDETDFQKKAVEAIGTEHRYIRCRESDIGEAFPDVIWHAEQPILRTAPAPLFMLSGLVNETGFKVVLTGEGADEVFAGYDIFKEDKIRRLWAADPDSTLRPKILKKIYPDIFSGPGAKFPKYLEEFFRKGLQNIASETYSHQTRWNNTSMLKAFLSKDLKRELAQEASFEERFIASLPAAFTGWHPLSKAQYTESVIFLSNYLLSAQGDRMAMAHSVEGRFPFLDHRIIEFAAGLPPRLKLAGLQEKYILRKTAERYLPGPLAYRPKKPYRAPISRCFFGTNRIFYVDEMLSDSRIRQCNYFDQEKVKLLINKCHENKGLLMSERENMAVTGILSTHLIDELYIRNYSSRKVHRPVISRRIEI